jgi:hypothetical protein
VEEVPVPIVERDPWRMQYFEDVICPDGLFIPTEDPDAWNLYPEHRAVYNKLYIAETQGLEHGPHGVMPARYPVFSKPIFNMKGMGAGSRIFETEEEYEHGQEPGHMWMELLTGEHVSTDVAVIGGEPQWWRHTTGISIGEGMFDFWTVAAEDRPELEEYCSNWLRRHLRGYSGIVNFETIGGRIIECHLRFADQWPDLYGSGWLESVVELYARRRWTFRDEDRRTGYSVVLFGGHGPHYRAIPQKVRREVRALPGVSSVQVTFHEDKDPELHSMPPGGFRLAIVNCWDLEVGRQARERLALEFWSTQDLVKGK